jgi:hypothetical protein
MALQMTCPHCKHEFPYDNGKLDMQISKLGQRIHEINAELTRIKAMSFTERKKRERTRRLLAVELTEANVKIGELKAVRKACDQQIKFFEYQTFKNIVKEKYGEAEYQKIIAQVQEELKAYKISGMMLHEYTRSNAKANVTSINKL